MLRVGMVCRMVPEKREEYLALHRAVWPGVEQTLREGNIRNFSIFVRGDVLFGYYAVSYTHLTLPTILLV